MVSRRWRQRASYLVRIMSLLLVLVLLGTQVARAETTKEYEVHNFGFYSADRGVCSNAVNAGGGNNTGINDFGGSIWNSGLQPPYILEQFAIETLKDVAQKRGVPESSALTEEHVIGLIAFMFGEGGDINNNDLFNPLNTGLNAPELLASANAANGVQSFKSFDAGVEATARTIVGSNQSRLADTLIDPATTADQFMYALTYYQNYPGNLFWAAASQPPNQDSYYQQRLQLVQQVRTNYNDIASLVLGTPAHEQVEGIRDASKLHFGGGGTGGGAPSTTGNNSCACSATAGSPAAVSNLIALDPGHSPDTDQAGRDVVTGLYNYDYQNDPEMADAYTAATKIKTLLEAKGYSVFITKNAADDKLNLSERAQRANDSHAGLLFTLHSNIDNNGAGTFYLGYPDDQSVRIPGKKNDPSQRLDGKTGLVHPEVEGPSKAFAEKMAPLISQKIGEAGYTARSFKTIYGENNLGGNGLNYGNTPVQTILTAIPEVYSEVRRDILPTDTFANAAADAISQALPLQGAGNDTAATASPTTTTNNGCAGSPAIVQTALGLVWPDSSHGAVPTDAYVQALAQFNPTVGKGIDCGAFVATVMHASGADPEYPPIGTSSQEAYVRSHPEKYTIIESFKDTSELLPGDILIVNKGGGSGGDGHTYIYVGSQPPNGYNAASASLQTSTIAGKAPHLGNAIPSDERGNYMIARLK